MIKIAHECPVAYFNKVREQTDYDYALVHLLDSNKEYSKKFYESKEMGREIILDNSIFELGEAFETKKYIKHIQSLQPTWYVVPDVLGDAIKTVERMKDWKDVIIPSKLSHIKSKTIGVLQGDTWESLMFCYKELDKMCDMIAIPHHLPYYTSIIPHNENSSSKHFIRMIGRVTLIKQLESAGILNEDKSHHLLGASLPQELILINSSKCNYIYSVDTSNPILHGIMGVGYGNFGLTDKIETKMDSLIDIAYNGKHLWKILGNMRKFREFASNSTKFQLN